MTLSHNIIEVLHLCHVCCIYVMSAVSMSCLLYLCHVCCIYVMSAVSMSCLLYHFNFPWQKRSKRKFLLIFLSLPTEVGLCKLPGNRVYIICSLFCQHNAIYIEHLIFFLAMHIYLTNS